MEKQDFTLVFKDINIKGQFIPTAEAKGVVVMVHGMGEHMGRYHKKVFPMLLKSGFAITAYDNIGHGTSGGKRGHCNSYEDLLTLVGIIIEKAEEHFPKLPVFLYGHSMGGNLVLNYSMRKQHNLSGVIASSPYLRLAFTPPKWKLSLGKLMMKLYPSITLASGLDPNGISRIPKEVKAYEDDALAHDKVSPMYTFPVMEAGEWVLNNANKLKTNTLLLHGTADAIIDYKATEELHQKVTTTTLELFEGGYHELHYDLCSNETLEAIQNWLQQQV